jgi:DNA-binding transcriptional ArsR family regulator
MPRTSARAAAPPSEHKTDACGPEALARYFRVLGDPTRLRILEALLERERSVSELVALLDAPQGRVSNHLACLRWCRFVEAERRGRRVLYRIADEEVRTLLARARALAEPNCDHLTACTRIGPDWI